ncbi:MAG: hypothetical protein ACYS19_20025 [Planctomycetota bacterium]
MITDTHFDFSTIEMIICPELRQINGKQLQVRLWSIMFARSLDDGETWSVSEAGYR